MVVADADEHVLRADLGELRVPSNGAVAAADDHALGMHGQVEEERIVVWIGRGDVVGVARLGPCRDHRG